MGIPKFVREGVLGALFLSAADCAAPPQEKDGGEVVSAAVIESSDVPMQQREDRKNRLGNLADGEADRIQKTKEILQLEYKYPDGPAVLRYVQGKAAEFLAAHEKGRTAVKNHARIGEDKFQDENTRASNERFAVKEALTLVACMHNWQQSAEAPQIAALLVDMIPFVVMKHFGLIGEVPDMDRLFETAVFNGQKVVMDRDVFFSDDVPTLDLNDPELAHIKITCILDQTLKKGKPIPEWVQNVLARAIRSKGVTVEDLGNLFVDYPQLPYLAKTLPGMSQSADKRKIEQAYKLLLRQKK